MKEQDVAPADRVHLQRIEPSKRFLSGLDAFEVDVIPSGPFRVLLHRESAAPDDSQALPYESLGNRDEAFTRIREMRRLFESRGRVPMVEFNEAYWPDLAILLQESGFQEDDREPLLYCLAAEFRPFVNPEIDVRFLQPADPDRDLVAFQSIFFEVLIGHAWEQTPEQLKAFRTEVERMKGRSHALASLDGVAVGTGFISSNDGVGEIHRVATLPAARRKGVAATLTSFMMAERFARGDDLIWLTAANVPAQALYEKLGYRRVGDRVYYRVEEDTRSPS